MANASTLFHLVPRNDLSRDVLDHPDNRRFVSPTSKGEMALEVGFHVAATPGRVIGRLGRDADLILRQRSVSAIHVAFEMHPETLVVLLSVRSKHTSSVMVTPREEDQPFESAEKEAVEGDCVLSYGREYEIRIVAYVFRLVWRQTVAPESLRELVIQEYQKALRQQGIVRSRNLATEGDSELHTWHNTRIHSTRQLIREADGVPRVRIGEGQFAEVYRAVDFKSGNCFAIKVIRLHLFHDAEHARAAAHRELKTLQRLNHKNIVELLGHAKWDTGEPEIFMPLRPGSLRSLARTQDSECSDAQLCTEVLRQCLSALDYLDLNNICHRDVKPENILYWDDARNGKRVFQLADFGLANHQSLATTRCGTGYYAAPELYLESNFSQSPKMDVWSLFATVIDVHHDFRFPPENPKTYTEILESIRVAALSLPQLAYMAQEDPNHRASAAQLLVHHFQGEGLSRPKAHVPPIDTLAAALTPRTTAGEGPAEPAKAARLPLIKYSRGPHRPRGQEIGKVTARTPIRRPQQQPPPSRPLGGGIGKLKLPSHPGEQPSSHKETIERSPRKEMEEDPSKSLFHVPDSFPS